MICTMAQGSDVILKATFDVLSKHELGQQVQSLKLKAQRLAGKAAAAGGGPEEASYAAAANAAAAEVFVPSSSIT